MAKIKKETQDELIELTLKELNKEKTGAEKSKDEMVELALKESQLQKEKTGAEKSRDEMIELALKESHQEKTGAERTKEGMVEATLKEMQGMASSLDDTIDKGPIRETVQEVLAERDRELKTFYKLMRWTIMHATEHQRQAEKLSQIQAQEQQQAKAEGSQLTDASDVKKLTEVIRTTTDWSKKMKAQDLSKAGADYTKEQERFKAMTGKDRLVRYTKDTAIIEKELEMIGGHFAGGGTDYKG